MSAAASVCGAVEGVGADVRSASFSVTFRDESSRRTEKQAGSRSAPSAPSRVATSRNPSLCAPSWSTLNPLADSSSLSWPTLRCPRTQPAPNGLRWTRERRAVPCGRGATAGSRPHGSVPRGMARPAKATHRDVGGAAVATSLRRDQSARPSGTRGLRHLPLVGDDRRRASPRRTLPLPQMPAPLSREGLVRSQ